jgi:V/A-type H+-transporting ATPase subunit A
VSAHGEVWRVAGPVLVARGLQAPRLYNVVHVGAGRIPGEIIRLEGDLSVIQVYEDTSGVAAGEAVEDTGQPLQVELGPGLLGSIFDGVQRPLPELAGMRDGVPATPMIERGARAAALDRAREWEFEPSVSEGDRVGPGELLGEVPEARAIVHRVLAPPGAGGRVTRVHHGPATVEQPVVWLDGEPLTMVQRWAAREARPVAHKLDADVPLVTGQRVIDTLFPVARGGSATIPGGFGTGKTVLEQSLAKWSQADVVVYVGCGERGNELTEVLEEFPELEDPRTGASLMERTVLVANTSNMTVAARESSIYTGMTLAEYYRDQGYHVALLADSTSRWAEALREVSSRLEEMPAEEGYPAYLSSRLAEFYERAGRAVCLGDHEREGSVTVVGAVSPPGGDFSEPVTQHSLRLAGTFWALDTELARQRHFPAVGWGDSYTLYALDQWFDDHVAADFGTQRAWTLGLLDEERAALETMELLGTEALAPTQRLVLRTGRLLREDFLQQSAFDEADAYCPPEKQFQMLRVIRGAHRAMERALEAGRDVDAVLGAGALTEIGRMRSWVEGDVEERADALLERIGKEVEGR